MYLQKYKLFLNSLLIKQAIKLQYLIFIWCGEYLPSSAHSNHWKPIEIPEPVKLGLLTKPGFNQNKKKTQNPIKPPKTTGLGFKKRFLQLWNKDWLTEWLLSNVLLCRVVWCRMQASYCVLLHMIRWIPSRPSIDGYELDVQLIVPAAAVGHIIGRHGRRVRQLESYSNVSIWTLNAPQPPPTPTGANRARVKITGNFWQTQARPSNSFCTSACSHPYLVGTEDGDRRKFCFDFMTCRLIITIIITNEKDQSDTVTSETLQGHWTKLN